MDYPKFIVSSQKEESICIQRVIVDMEIAVNALSRFELSKHRCACKYARRQKLSTALILSEKIKIRNLDFARTILALV